MKIFLFLFTGIWLTACSSAPPLQVSSAHLQSRQVTHLTSEADAIIVKIAAIGDVMLGTDFPEDRLAADDGQTLLRAASPLLQQADIAFANLEGVLQDGGEPRKQCKDTRNCYLFRSPARYVRHLKNAGIDILSLANNHARDFGEEGRTVSMQILDNAGLQHSGRLGDVAYRQVKGKRVALIAFAPFANANDMLDLDLAHKTVAQLSHENDIVIVSIHAGAEGGDVQHLTFAEEMYHGERRGDSVAFAHRVIDAGADLVIGHGPHVPRAVELYKQRLIAYSLGNFCTFWGIKITGKNGLAPLLSVNLTGDGRFLDGQIHSFRQSRPEGSLPDPIQAAARLIAELTQQDFPYGWLRLNSDGKIEPLQASSH